MLLRTPATPDAGAGCPSALPGVHVLGHDDEGIEWWEEGPLEDEEAAAETSAVSEAEAAPAEDSSDEEGEEEEGEWEIGGDGEIAEPPPDTDGSATNRYGGGWQFQLRWRVVAGGAGPCCGAKQTCCSKLSSVCFIRMPRQQTADVICTDIAA
jgi:hypothetical protein